MATPGFFDRLANIAGKTAVVIGGGDGVGRGVTLALAEAGCDLILCDNAEPEMEETVDLARKFGGKVLSAAVDATVPEQLSAFYDLVEQEYPDGVDIAVNVVGGVKRAMFTDTTREDWQRDIQTNYGYAIESCRRAIDLMRRKGNGGSIINFTTIEAHRGAGSFAVYAGAKAALTNFTRAIAVELGPEGIRVNCVVPDTTPSKTSMKSLQPDVLAQNAKIKPGQWDRMWPLYVPLGYCPPVEDLAKGVLYLASDLSTSVTGMTLHVDGGTYAASGFLNWPHGIGLLPTASGGALDALYPAQPGDDEGAEGAGFLGGA